MANTWFNKTDKRKIIYSTNGCETEIDFVLVSEKYKKYIRDVKVILWEFQQRLVVVDLNRKGSKKVVRKERIIRVIIEKRVEELVSTDAPNLWKTFKDGVLKTSDEVCKRRSLREIKETCGGGMKRSRIP